MNRSDRPDTSASYLDRVASLLADVDEEERESHSPISPTSFETSQNRH